MNPQTRSLDTSDYPPPYEEEDSQRAPWGRSLHHRCAMDPMPLSQGSILVSQFLS